MFYRKQKYFYLVNKLVLLFSSLPSPVPYPLWRREWRPPLVPYVLILKKKKHRNVIFQK